MNIDIIDNKFTIKDENYLKRLKYLALILLPISMAIIFLFIGFPIIIMIVIYLFVVFIAIWFFYGLTKAEKELPTKVRIDEKGIYVWKKNNSEEFVHWDAVSGINNSERLAPNLYYVEREKKIWNYYPNDIILCSKAGKIATLKFNEYKLKMKKMIDN